MSIAMGTGDVILSIRPRMAQRVVSVAAMLAIAGLLGAVALGPSEHGPVWRLALLAAAAGFGLLAARFWAATSVAIELTQDALRTSGGVVLAPVAQIERVDKGVFALKPSNGVLIVTASPAPMAWQPGLWWRYGRRIGIGGATSSAQAKAIADTITLMMAEQEDGARD